MDLKEAVGELWERREELTEWELTFISDNLARSEFSERQRDTLLDIYYRRVESPLPQPISLTPPEDMQYCQWCKRVREEIGGDVDWHEHEPSGKQFFMEGQCNHKTWTIASKQDPGDGFILTIDGKHGQVRLSFLTQMSHTLLFHDLTNEVLVDVKEVLYKGVMGWDPSGPWSRVHEHPGLKGLTKDLIGAIWRCQRVYLRANRD